MLSGDTLAGAWRYGGVIKPELRRYAIRDIAEGKHADIFPASALDVFRIRLMESETLEVPVWHPGSATARGAVDWAGALSSETFLSWKVGFRTVGTC